VGPLWRFRKPAWNGKALVAQSKSKMTTAGARQLVESRRETKV
jgi:hypothetical protein